MNFWSGLRSSTCFSTQMQRGLKGGTVILTSVSLYRVVCFCVRREWSAQSIFVSLDEPFSNSCLFAYPFEYVNGGTNICRSNRVPVMASYAAQDFAYANSIFPALDQHEFHSEIFFIKKCFRWLRFHGRVSPVITALPYNANEHNFLFICTSGLISRLGLEPMDPFNIKIEGIKYI